MFSCCSENSATLGEVTDAEQLATQAALTEDPSIYQQKALVEEAPAAPEPENGVVLNEVRVEIPSDEQPAQLVGEEQMPGEASPDLDPNVNLVAQPPDGELLPMYTVSVSSIAGKSFGAEFDLTDQDRPIITKVLPDTYLSSGLPAPCPTIGSALVSVNDKVTNGPDMVKLLQGKGPVSAIFKEPRRRTIVLSPGAGSQGLDLKPTSSDDLGLLVLTSSGPTGLQARDFIVEVNGQRNTPQVLHDMVCISTNGVQLGILSYSEEAQQRTVIVPKENGPLGLELKEVSKGVPAPGLYVLSSTGRAAAAGVRSSDTIIGVNGQFIAPSQLFGLLRAGGKDMKLVIMTPPS